MTSRRDRLEPSPAAAAVALLLVVVVAGAPASGQVATSCTASLISTFTPCLNFVTGSTNGGGSPTKQCCGVLAEMVRTGADCACLILTGNVPFSLPINRTLAVSLPKLCSSTSVPLQCRDTATQIPAPGNMHQHRLVCQYQNNNNKRNNLKSLGEDEQLNSVFFFLYQDLSRSLRLCLHCVRTFAFSAHATPGRSPFSKLY
uniref:Bifunctional inhibitor/plant lipid transfer protein/seed storage helical domain-containing protein n=1 Tax=Zea mays TaxID=4577 RepID=A0A804M5E7_MAIZE